MVKREISTFDLERLKSENRKSKEEIVRLKEIIKELKESEKGEKKNG